MHATVVVFPGSNADAEAGLLPCALMRNEHLRFECRDVFVSPASPGPFTSGLPNGPRKNVFGLMPHPERMSGGADGGLFFDALLRSAGGSRPS